MNRNLLYKYVCVVDYEKDDIDNRVVTDDLNGYILELYKIVEDSEKLQFFKHKDLTTQVLSNVLQIIKKLNNGDTEDVSSMMDSVSNRLKDKERTAQKQVEHLGVQVKKGSLLQAVFKNSLYDEFEYLISKTEHNRYMDEKDYNIKQGFKIDEKNLWKSCLIRCTIEEEKVEIKEIRVYLDNSSKYWTREFLELEELRNDQQNTQQFFREVDRVLKKDVFRYSKEDYNSLRIGIIQHIRSAKQIDYPKIIKEKFEDYKYVELEEKHITKLIKDLKDLGDKGSFDTQFEPDPNALSVRIVKETYKLTNDVELIVKDINSDDKIEAFEDSTGKKYIKIETDNETVFKKYRK